MGLRKMHSVLLVSLFSNSLHSEFRFVCDTCIVGENYSFLALFLDRDIRDALVRDSNKCPWVCCAPVEINLSEDVVHFDAMLSGFEAINVSSSSDVEALEEFRGSAE